MHMTATTRAPKTKRAASHHVNPTAWHAKNWLQHRWRQIPSSLIWNATKFLRPLAPGVRLIRGTVDARILYGDGTQVDLGRIGAYLYTNAGMAYVAGAVSGATTTPSNMKYGGFGTGTTAAAATQTALVTEISSDYATASTRPTGTQSRSTTSVTNDTYKCVATCSPTASVAITEFGLFDQAATGGGTMLDREVFSAINLTSSDSLQMTLTFQQS